MLKSYSSTVVGALTFLYVMVNVFPLTKSAEMSTVMVLSTMLGALTTPAPPSDNFASARCTVAIIRCGIGPIVSGAWYG